MPMASLQTNDLTIGYKDTVIASGLDITLFPGKVTAMLGENGAGKSTLIKTLTGEIKPLGGSIEICGKPLESYTPASLAKTIAIVTTGDIQAGGLRVKELVGLGRQPHTDFFGRLSAYDKRIVEEAMQSVGISHKADSYVATLSDGERQKALIARAIAQQTPLILLDEPFSFLDVASRVEILSLLIGSARENGTTILFSSHDVAQALRMADDILLFTPESGVTQASPLQLISSGRIKDLFPDRDVIFDSTQNDFVSTLSYPHKI